MQSMIAEDIPIGLFGAAHVTNPVMAGGDMTMLLGMEEKNARRGIKKTTIKIRRDRIFQPSGLESA